MDHKPFKGHLVLQVEAQGIRDRALKPGPQQCDSLDSEKSEWPQSFRYYSYSLGTKVGIVYKDVKLNKATLPMSPQHVFPDAGVRL